MTKKFQLYEKMLMCSYKKVSNMNFFTNALKYFIYNQLFQRMTTISLPFGAIIKLRYILSLNGQIIFDRMQGQLYMTNRFFRSFRIFNSFFLFIYFV